MRRGRGGFTLIELLIVVVIIGILAGIAIPKFALTKQRAFISAMKSDLRNLMTAEETYYIDALAYSADLTAIGATASADVTLTITLGTSGWSAAATHPQTTTTCEIGTGDMVPAGAAEGEPICS
jgi:prepilin-type N-terminal cleavage/methylation domain-containing protein